MARTGTRGLAWTLAAAAVAMELGCHVVVLVAGAPELATDVLRAAFVAILSILGRLIATRHARNSIGWIFLAAALTSGLFDLGAASVDYRLQVDGDSGTLVGLIAACINVAWTPGVLVPATFLLLLFPAGRLPSSRWRPVAWSAGAGIGAFVVGLATAPGPLDNFASIQNPLGVDALGPLIAIGTLLVGGATVASAISVGVRYRRVDRLQRQQIKWLVLAGAIVAVVVPVRAVLEATGADPNVANSMLLLALLGLPAAAGLAILRYRLYDIDVVINRALVYVALTATLGAAYLGSVLLLQLVLSGITSSNGLAVAASTLAVAALFQPARRRIQGSVDRRFFRGKYDAVRTLERFGARLRDEIDLDALGVELRDVVAQTMQPAHVSLWLRAPEAGR